MPFDKWAAQDFYAGIYGCRCGLKRHPNWGPFVFRMKEQPVAVISVTPTAQAIYRPLSSIRFLRTLFRALFGANPDIGDLSPWELFSKHIYWTHYCKCHYPAYQREPLRLPPDTCAERHLKKELDILDPSMVVVIGQSLCKQLAKTSPNNREPTASSVFGHECRCLDFPVTGREPAFARLRKELRCIIPQVDADEESGSVASAMATEQGSLLTHARFELSGLQRYWAEIKRYRSGLFSLVSQDEQVHPDDLWYRREVIPRLLYQTFIVACDTFIEDQLDFLEQTLAAAPAEREHGQINTDVIPDRSKGDEGSRRARFSMLHRLVGQSLERLLGSNVTDRLRELRNLRNCIVHNAARQDDNPDFREYLALFQTKGEQVTDSWDLPLWFIDLTEEQCLLAYSTAESFVNSLRNVSGQLGKRVGHQSRIR